MPDIVQLCRKSESDICVYVQCLHPSDGGGYLFCVITYANHNNYVLNEVLRNISTLAYLSMRDKPLVTYIHWAELICLTILFL